MEWKKWWEEDEEVYNYRVIKKKGLETEWVGAT